MNESTNYGGGPGTNSILGLALQDVDRFGAGILAGAFDKAETWPPMALAVNVGWMVDNFDRDAAAAGN